MPKLWNATIETHRNTVRDAILGTTWKLVTERGLASVTMSQIAEETGIGRATLYKYYPDVETIVSAWHRRHVDQHLDHLAEISDQNIDPGQRLRAVLEAYARIAQKSGRQGAELGALLHRGEHVAEAQQKLVSLLSDLLSEAVTVGHVRDDVAPGELARYCLHALTAAGTLDSDAAVRRLVEVTLAGLRL